MIARWLLVAGLLAAACGASAPPASLDLPAASVTQAAPARILIESDEATRIVDAATGQPAEKTLPGGLLSPAKDLIVSGLSGQDMAELSTAEGRTKAKDALTQQISAAYRGVVYEVFFVEFVMQ